MSKAQHTPGSWLDGKAEKRAFYCKAGAYDHVTRYGWVWIVDGRVVLGDSVKPSNRCYGAARHDFPEFRTRRELLEEVNERAAIAKAKGE